MMRDLRSVIERDIENYFVAWESYLAKYLLQPLASRILPSAVGWKVADLAQFYSSFEELLVHGSQAHIGRVNDRFIASVVLDNPLPRHINIVKLMQRRPGSDDQLGLDHIDFTVNDLTAVERTLVKAKIPRLEHESNNAHKWLSLRFGDHEAKFVDHTVLDVCIAELQQAH